MWAQGYKLSQSYAAEESSSVSTSQHPSIYLRQQLQHFFDLDYLLINTTKSKSFSTMKLFLFQVSHREEITSHIAEDLLKQQRRKNIKSQLIEAL